MKKSEDYRADPLIGKLALFPKPEETSIEHQGEVVDRLDDGRYLVQMFSWLTGANTNQQVFSVTSDWLFFDNLDEFQERAERVMDKEAGR